MWIASLILIAYGLFFFIPLLKRMEEAKKHKKIISWLIQELIDPFVVTGILFGIIGVIILSKSIIDFFH